MMRNQKETWNSLSLKNAHYYICALENDSEEDFHNRGKQDCELHIFNDDIIQKTIDMGKSTILEVGCGIGRMTEFMAQKFRVVLATDISGEMIRLAKERVKTKNIEFLETNGSTFPFMDNSIDLAFSYLVFRHIDDPNMVESNFRDINRMLRANGIFKVQMRLLPTDINQWYGGVAYNFNSATVLCKKSNFEIIHYKEIGTRGLWLWLKKIGHYAS